MGKYSMKSKCIKCGEQGAKSTYQRLLGVEHIKRTCDNCGYNWEEEPLEIYNNTKEIKNGIARWNEQFN